MEKKLTPDEWAQELRLLPPQPKRPGAPAPILPLLEGAKVYHHWLAGDLLTEAEFKAGMKKFGELPLGGEEVSS